MKRIFTAVAVLAWMPATALACGSSDPKVTIGNKTVTVSMRDDMSPVVSQVIDDDGVFVTHFVASYCALSQGENSKNLDCWKDAAPALIKSSARTAEYWKTDYIAYIDSSELSVDNKAAEKKRALDKAEYWAKMNSKFKAGVTLEEFRTFIKSPEFEEGKDNNYNFAQPLSGKEPRYRTETLGDIYGMLGMNFDGIPSSEHSRCGEPSLAEGGADGKPGAAPGNAPPGTSPGALNCTCLASGERPGSRASRPR